MRTLNRVRIDVSISPKNFHGFYFNSLCEIFTDLLVVITALNRRNQRTALLILRALLNTLFRISLAYYELWITSEGALACRQISLVVELYESECELYGSSALWTVEFVSRDTSSVTVYFQFYILTSYFTLYVSFFPKLFHLAEHLEVMLVVLRNAWQFDLFTPSFEPGTILLVEHAILWTIPDGFV
jgi:hypothetical protein